MAVERVAPLTDEDHPVPNLIIAPTANAGTNTTVAATHSALLRTWEELLGIPVLPSGSISLRPSAHI